jgi:hypothetical protein
MFSSAAQAASLLRCLPGTRTQASRAVRPSFETRASALLKDEVNPRTDATKAGHQGDLTIQNWELNKFHSTALNSSQRTRYGWICDKQGRNKRDDLRSRITSVELTAEL